MNTPRRRTGLYMMGIAATWSALLGGCLEVPDEAASVEQAIGTETLGCYVNVGLPGTFTSPSCRATRALFTYDIPFHVLGASGTYAYAWTTSGGSVVSGCTPTSDSCSLHVLQREFDQTVTASVVLTQAGQQRTISASARLFGVCASVHGPVLC